MAERVLGRNVCQNRWGAPVQARLGNECAAPSESELAAARAACEAAGRAVATAEDAQFEAGAAQGEADRLARCAPCSAHHCT